MDRFSINVNVPRQNDATSTAIALGRAVEDRLIPAAGRSVATSLLKAFSSETSWTPRQAAKAWAMLQDTRQVAGLTTELPPAPAVNHGIGLTKAEWCAPERQALRGIKMGIVKRAINRERDTAIERHLRTRKHTRAELAAHHSISTRQVTRIAKRIATGLVDISRRTVAPVTSLLVKNVKAFLSRSKGGDTNHSEDGRVSIPHAYMPDIQGRKPRLMTGLAKWMRLDCNANATERDVLKEARYLNTLEPEPLSEKYVQRIAKKVFDFSIQFFDRHQCAT